MSRPYQTNPSWFTLQQPAVVSPVGIWFSFCVGRQEGRGNQQERGHKMRYTGSLLRCNLASLQEAVYLSRSHGISHQLTTPRTSGSQYRDQHQSPSQILSNNSTARRSKLRCNRGKARGEGNTLTAMNYVCSRPQRYSVRKRERERERSRLVHMGPCHTDTGLPKQPCPAFLCNCTLVRCWLINEWQGYTLETVGCSPSISPPTERISPPVRISGANHRSRSCLSAS